MPVIEVIGKAHEYLFFVNSIRGVVIGRFQVLVYLR